MASRRTNASIANSPARPATAAAGGEFRSHALTLPPAAAGLRFDQALARALPQYSRTLLKSWIDSGAARIEDRVMRARDRVRGGERVLIDALLPQRTEVTPEDLPLRVVFRDRALLVIDKPAGLVVHPGAGNPRHTLQNALLGLDGRLALVPRAGLVHRLDKDTSGLLLVARTPEAHTALAAALAARQISRQYLAVCSGVMTGGGTVDEPIGRHRTQRLRMAVRAAGRRAVTHYRVVERFRAHTLVRIELETGRTHQIRVHLAHIGFPVVGDPLYAGRRRLPAGCTAELAAVLGGFRRQALHAARLALVHPLTGRAMQWESPLPEDMRALLAALEADRA
ncbi:MAG TPA: 23S rRNA pseudouridine(1911/1915/1917) synthase RluD [Steroidobacteraceae bacterium]|nr:23S rRNA pseudouridine(1911/1915/1917) synthase RluD [Steroidobacteraceae bacterium]